MPVTSAMRQPTRREALSSIVTVTAGGLGYSLASDGAQAQSDLNLESFDIEDADKTVVDGVSSARLNVNCDYRIEAEKQPTRVVLRLEGKRTNDYTQLSATELTGLESNMSGSKDMQGDLLSLPNVEAADLSPTEQGETKTVELSIRFLLTVKRNGKTLSENSVADSVTINVTKGTASATIELGGAGSVAISES